MSASWWTAVVGAAALTCASCGASVPALPPLGPGDTILAFGDSLTYGTGAGVSEAYPAVLATLVGREVVAAGVPGEVTAAGLRRLPAALDRVRPKLLLLCLGGNDMLQRIDASMTAANLRSMVQVARDRGVPVVLIGVPKAPLFSGNVDYFEVIAREFAIPLENEIMASLFYDGSSKSDAVHPNAAGYRRMAEALAVLLRRAGAVD